METEGMYSEVYAGFELFGTELNPDEVTGLVGITPSRAWRIGDPQRPPIPGVHKNSGWILKSDLPLSAYLDDHVMWVLERLRPSWSEFARLGAQYEAIISCVVKSYGGDRPPITFEPEVVKRVAELNAALDVDLYVFN